MPENNERILTVKQREFDFTDILIDWASKSYTFLHCLLDFRTSNELPDVDAEDAADLFLAKTIQSMEEKMNRADESENVHDEHTSDEDIGSGNVYVTLKKHHLLRNFFCFIQFVRVPSTKDWCYWLIIGHLSWSMSVFIVLVLEGVLDVQTRVLKAKLRIMQELDHLSHEYYKKVL